MCCFRLHFSDINVLFFQKIKNLLQFTFEKITCCAKREKKITCPEEKSQPHPPGYQMVCPLAKYYLSTNAFTDRCYLRTCCAKREQKERKK